LYKEIQAKVGWDYVSQAPPHITVPVLSVMSMLVSVCTTILAHYTTLHSLFSLHIAAVPTLSPP
jgi:hypothetical protein